MALSNYGDLKLAVSNWMARADLSGDAADFISLAEARLNRELDPVELDATLSGVISTNRIDVSALSVESPVALFLAETGLDEAQLTPKADGTFSYLATAGRPRFWAMDGNNAYIDFDRPLDSNYPFRFRYRQRFALSDSAPTNWLLTNHNDAYLAAVLMWGGLFIRDNPYAGTFKPILDEAMPEIRHQIALSKRAELTVDRALEDIGRQYYRGYRIVE
jgi:hypothetical protein